jgi:hypothetical protein
MNQILCEEKSAPLKTKTSQLQRELNAKNKSGKQNKMELRNEADDFFQINNIFFGKKEILEILKKRNSQGESILLNLKKVGFRSES